MDQDARLDSKTGLYPQKMLEQLLAGELIRTKRYPGPISVMYIGLRFEENPTSEILESARSILTNILQSRLREVDIPGHYQGNYLVVMPASDAQGARRAAQRLVDHFQGKQVTRELNEYKVSICAGVATHCGENDITSDELLSRASTALWEAHRQGPRSLIVFDDLSQKTIAQ
jgi:diguanylate cyclase (GGDEF)-like protein